MPIWPSMTGPKDWGILAFWQIMSWSVDEAGW